MYVCLYVGGEEQEEAVVTHLGSPSYPLAMPLRPSTAAVTGVSPICLQNQINIYIKKGREGGREGKIKERGYAAQGHASS